MWNWIMLNKQWVFSGIGISALAAAWWLLKKVGTLGSASPASSAQTNANSVVQSPVITVNFPPSPAPASAAAPVPDAQARPLPAAQEPEIRPQIYSLTPRITHVSEVDPEEGTGIIEGGNDLKAVVATFRMRKSSSDGHATYLTARLSYRPHEDIGIRDLAKEIHRVNYGTWLDEEFNFVEMAITDTKELVLVMQAHGGGVSVAVLDNRHSATKYNGLAYHRLELDVDSFFVDVTLVDGNHGPLVTYTYKIDTDPLAVHEIIRVPRGG
jgi:hypothetical protein